MTATNAAETRWGPGPWSGEPDRDQWTDPDTGLLCLAIRFPRTGHWNGYVAIPEGHPLHKITAWNLPRLDVHCGINYAHHGDKHVSWHPGREDGNWWIGFSCDHIGDEVPAETAARDDFGMFAADRIYRDLRFVRAECTTLAAQIKENEK
ncbi:hypothetical protein [Streptomyces sp. NPDC057554]|uniref:hypothetical protein n=1 Tax=Streptomyces sp. NPDC057554 TaxID=3350538 RepID=UPI0036AA0165